MDEKMMILKMLEEGKINAEEALKLLESIEKNNQSDPKASSNKDGNRAATGKLNDTLNKFSKKAEEFADKYGPEFIEKIESISNDFANAAVKFADKIVNFINSGFNNTDIYKTLSKQFTIPVKENSKLIIRTQNIAITTHKTDKPEVIVDLKLKSFFENTDIDDLITLKNENDTLYLVTNLHFKMWGFLEIYIPESIKSVDIETSNSKCSLSDFIGDNLNCTTSNGKIEMASCSAKSLVVRTNNSKIKISGTKSNEAEIMTSNSNIEFDDCRFDNLKSFTSNGSIYLNNFDSVEETEGKYVLQTSNGKISINLGKNMSADCKIKASTSVGNIKVSELDPSYFVEKDKGNVKAEAIIQSRNYDTSNRKIFIEASTSNSSIYINGD